MVGTSATETPAITSSQRPREFSTVTSAKAQSAMQVESRQKISSTMPQAYLWAGRRRGYVSVGHCVASISRIVSAIGNVLPATVPSTTRTP